MGRVVSDDTIDGDINGRAAGEFKDGTFVRRVEVLPENIIVFEDTENHELYRETSCPKNYKINTISTEHSSFTGTVILILGGFTPDTGNARVVTISTDYVVKPEVPYQG